MTEEGQRRVADLRRHYRLAGLAETDLAADPMTQFDRWFAEAVAAMDEAGFPEPNAMVVATAGADGRPSTRMVLLKGYGPEGFVLFTNYGSRKAREIAANPQVSLHFPWVVLQRQVVVTGRAERISRAETEAYFASRPYGSRIGAWASPQSQVVPHRAALEEAYAAAAARYPDDGPVPAPEHWGGIRVVPDAVEFWQGRPNRLHDRLRYRRDEGAPGGWLVERLAP
ncbi:MAG: pyridoxamine 5'-phosphate oxidase [Frankiaceae bacterium]